MRAITGITFMAILGISACGDSEQVTETKTEKAVASKPVKKEHFMSQQKSVLDNAKLVQGVANDATARRQQELDKQNK